MLAAVSCSFITLLPGNAYVIPTNVRKRMAKGWWEVKSKRTLDHTKFSFVLYNIFAGQFVRKYMRMYVSEGLCVRSHGSLHFLLSKINVCSLPCSPCRYQEPHKTHTARMPTSAMEKERREGGRIQHFMLLLWLLVCHAARHSTISQASQPASQPSHTDHKENTFVLPTTTAKWHSSVNKKIFYRTSTAAAAAFPDSGSRQWHNGIERKVVILHWDWWKVFFLFLIFIQLIQLYSKLYCPYK